MDIIPIDFSYIHCIVSDSKLFSHVYFTRTSVYRIASIPADGIGPEVVSAAIEVVNKLAQTIKTFTIEFTHIPWGTDYYKKHGRYVDENVLDVLRGYDASLFGSVGAPGKSWP